MPTEQDELEFATKEDLEAIKADPRLSKLHQAMLAGVNKKFQSFAEEKKQLLKTVDNLQAQVAELDGSLREWEDWFTANKDVLMSTNIDDGEQRKSRYGGGDEGMNSLYEKKYNDLVRAINQAGMQFEKKLAQMGKMLSLSMQLNDLYRQNPNMDAEKVLETALRMKETDLNKAYYETYQDEILNKQVEERLGPRLEEEVQKRLTKVETGSGATPIKFEIPKETPKTWTDAGQEFLQERLKEAAKP